MTRQMTRFALALAALMICAGSGPLDAQRATTPGSAVAAKPAASGDPINLNSATAMQIADLPGIGLKTAELIVEYRVKNGPFKKIEEIMNVRGVGEKSFLRIKDRLSVAAAKPEK